MTRLRRAVGWAAVCASCGLASVWAFWGAIETFHEGWYAPTLAENAGVMLVQYLGPGILFTTAGLVGVRWPYAGGGAHLALAGAAVWFLRGSSPRVLLPMIVVPLLILGLGYVVGRAVPRRAAILLLAVAPAAVALLAAAAPAYRVARRFDDGEHGARRLTANGLDLVWAPEGPGWPRSGVTWEEARTTCRHLSDDGTTLLDSPRDVWRLPTVDEAVRAQCRGGKNAAGSWDPRTSRASYREGPDKESPLWDPGSKVIYWWTATELDADTAAIIVYDGKVWPRPKSARWGYLGFRAVRSPERGLADGRPSGD